MVSAGRSPSAGVWRRIAPAVSVLLSGSGNVARRGRASAGGASDASTLCCAASSARASSSVTARKRTRSPALSWPIFHSSAATIVAGQTKPPRLGPSGPRITGMSPVKSIGADRVGVVVDVRRVQPGLAAVAARPRRLRADQAHAGAAGVVVHAPLGGEEDSRCRRREEVGRAVRPVEHRDLPAIVQHRDQRGRQCARFRRRRLARPRVSPMCSTSPGAQRAPAVAAEQPQRERRAAAEIGGHVDAAADREVGAAARRRAPPASAAAARPRPRTPASAATGAPSSVAPMSAPRERDHRGVVKAQRRPDQRASRARRRRRGCRPAGSRDGTTGRPSAPTAARRRPSSRGARVSPAPWSACRLRAPRSCDGE